MVNYCVAYGCKEKYKKGSSVTFHSFPTDPFRRKLWELKVRRENFSATRNSKLCSKHFTPDSFDNKGYGFICLKRDAVPTVFVYSPLVLHMKRKTPEVHNLNYSRRKVLASNEGLCESTVAIKQDETSSETLFNSILSRKTPLWISNETLIEPDIANKTLSKPKKEHVISNKAISGPTKQINESNKTVITPVAPRDLIMTSNETVNALTVSTNIPINNASVPHLLVNQPVALNSMFGYPQQFVMSNNILSEGTVHSMPLILSYETSKPVESSELSTDCIVSGKMFETFSNNLSETIASRLRLVMSKESTSNAIVFSEQHAISNQTGPESYLSRQQLLKPKKIPEIEPARRSVHLTGASYRGFNEIDMMLHEKAMKFYRMVNAEALCEKQEIIKLKRKVKMTRKYVSNLSDSICNISAHS